MATRAGAHQTLVLAPSFFAWHWGSVQPEPREGEGGISLSLWSQPTGRLLSGICELVKHGTITSSPRGTGALCGADSG